MAPSAIEVSENCVSIYEREKALIKSDQDGFHRKDGKQLVHDAMLARVDGLDTNTCEPGEEDAFFVADMGEVYRQHLRWKMNLKRIKPHYGTFCHAAPSPVILTDRFFTAVKCNPDPEVLRLLAALGTGFDCASKTEIDQVLHLGVDPARIIYAQPCKTRSHIRHAAAQGVKQMTFDNADELYKVHALFPDAELYLRILTDDSASLCRLSLKFGASLDCTANLLALARELHLNVVGVSFHVGSGASDPASFVKAVQDARCVFDQAAAVGYELRHLDVGGGFTGDLFESMAALLSEAVDTYFPPSVRILGEPGRYFVSAAYTLACNVIARRDVRDPDSGETSYMLYLNDGVYGNFSCIIFDHQNPVPRVLSAVKPAGNVGGYDSGDDDRDEGYATGSEGGPGGSTAYSLWGPTCDGIDRIAERARFAGRTLDVGDWLYFEDMGAYTRCSATRFNGFTDRHHVVYVSSEPGASAILNY